MIECPKNALYPAKRRSMATRSLITLVLIGSLIAGASWLWMSPLAPIPAKAAIGKLNLTENGANLQVRFVPPKRLSSITIVFPKPMQGSQTFCAHPDFPLSLRVRVSEPRGTNIIDDLITRDRMEWTSWHDTPSLVLMLQGWLGQHLSTDRDYDLSLSVDSAVADLGEAEVFLDWLDGGYIWGRERQNLQLKTRPTFRALNSPDTAILDRDRQLVTTILETLHPGVRLTGTQSDILVLQQIFIDRPSPKSTEGELIAVGTCLGDLLRPALGMEWVRYTDEHGTDLALRYGQTSIVIFPQDMIIKRVEQNEKPDLEHLFNGVIREVQQLVASREYR